MSEISNWLISIMSVAIGGVLVNLLLPNGKLNGFIKAIFGFLSVTVIISPLPKILNKQIQFNDILYNESATNIDQDYVDSSIKKIITSLEDSCKIELKNKGFDNVVVAISYIIEDYVYDIKKITLNIKNLVINSNTVHINKYTEMKQIVISHLGVSDVEVEFYE